MGSVSKPPFLSSSSIYGRLCKLCRQSCLSAQPALSSKPFQIHNSLTTKTFARTPSESSLKPLSSSQIYGRLCKLCRQSCLSAAPKPFCFHKPLTTNTFARTPSEPHPNLLSTRLLQPSFCTHSVRATPKPLCSRSIIGIIYIVADLSININFVMI